MKIYTRKGDNGITSIFNGKKISKSDNLFDAIGTADELNSFIGLAIAGLHQDSYLISLLLQEQNHLFILGSVLAEYHEISIHHKDVLALEEAIDDMEKKLPPLTEFILPGGSNSSSYLHVARSVCRRLERHLVKQDAEKILIQYTNRLSDFLFVAARFANHEAGLKDVIWRK